MNTWIDDKLDEFFDEKGNRYIDMDIFKEIFDKLATPEYKINQPELYKSELGRIRDLHNTFTFAFEEGREIGRKKAREEGRIEGEAKGRKEVSLKAAKVLLNEGFEITKIIDITGLTKQEIENLKP